MINSSRNGWLEERDPDDGEHDPNVEERKLNEGERDPNEEECNPNE